MSLQAERYLLPYCCTYNAFFMDLPGPTIKSVDFVVGKAGVVHDIDYYYGPYCIVENS